MQPGLLFAHLHMKTNMPPSSATVEHEIVELETVERGMVGREIVERVVVACNDAFS